MILCRNVAQRLQRACLESDRTQANCDGVLGLQAIQSTSPQQSTPQTYAQCSGKGRQTADFLFTIIRLFDLTREWGNSLAVFKMDLEKAFDSLDRGGLLERLEQKIGPGAELNCWRGLLRGTVGLLQILYPDPREDPKSRSLNGGSYKVPLVV